MEQTEETHFVVVIKEVVTIRKPETKVVHVLEDGTEKDWYEMDAREKKECKGIRVASGVILTEEKTKEIYSQSFDTLDVKQVAGFLNAGE